jgi:hypothetical protein
MSDLPPLDQPQAYVVVGPNDQRGPYTMELLISEVVAGRLSDATPVWWPALTDWTTLAAHPAVAAEISRRRAAAAPAPAWAAPAPAPETAAPEPVYGAQPSAEPAAAEAAAEPAAPAEPSYQPQPEPIDATAYAAPVADPFAPAAAEPAAIDDDEPVLAEVVEVIDVTELTDSDGTVVAEVVEVTDVVEIDPEALAHYQALVSRSAVRADAQQRIDAVDEALVAAVIEGARGQGFDLDDRVDVDRGHELRFGEAGGDLLVISLGRIAAVRPDDIRTDHVPVTVSYRSGSYEGAIEPGDGTHGDVVITADEWTGQATSSVSLFLGLDDYVAEDLTLDDAAVGRDVGAVIAVVRGRLA